MKTGNFIANHINATATDLAGNDGIGRYIFLPGSDGRAKDIAKHFDQLTVKSHARGHHLYTGSLLHKGKPIDVAVISSGMGCPSMEIILHELFHLGGKRFLRVGTAGSLQMNTIKAGDIINVQASVRDEQTTLDYMPITVPAIASNELITVVDKAAMALGISDHVYTGIVHCKSSLYAREFGAGPNASTNIAYLHLLSQCGVLASEMETAALFVQTQLYRYQLSQVGKGPAFKVLAGAILEIQDLQMSDGEAVQQTSKEESDLITLAFESIKLLSESE